MSIDTIEKKLHINSRAGQAIFESILVGSSFFVFIFVIFSVLKIMPNATILKASFFSAGFGILISLLNKFSK